LGSLPLDLILGVVVAVLEAFGEQIGDGVAPAGDGGVAHRLPLADLRRQQDEGGALAPLGTGDRIVVERLDRHLHREVAVLQERVFGAELDAALVDRAAALFVAQLSADLLLAGAEHQGDLAQAVVVGRLPMDRDAGMVEQAFGRRGAFEAHEGRVIGDGVDPKLERLGDADVAEACGHAQIRVVGDRPARDQGALAVVAERDLLLAVGEHEIAVAVDGDGVDGDGGTDVQRGGAVGPKGASRHLEVGGRLDDEARQLDPSHGHRRQTVAGREHVHALEDAERVESDGGESAQADGEGGAGDEPGVA